MTTNRRISVVVPYFNEVGSLTYLLDNLAQQTRQPDEVILVNSSSTDRGPALVNAWITSQHDGDRYKNLDAHTTTPGGSKSAGIRASSGDLIAFMDCGLVFPSDWLESQVDFLQTTGADWVSGVCRTEGNNLVDKAAIAHTYGFRQIRPVIPSSVMHRHVFDTVGEFRDLRAGYDVEWTRKANRLRMRREINKHVIVQYHDINFAPNLNGVFSKSVRYARPSVARSDARTPYIYVLGALCGLGLVIVSPRAALLFAIAYLIARSLLAWRRSNEFGFFLRNPFRLIVLNIVAATMDFGKLVGFVSGLFVRFVRRRTFTH